MPLRLSCIVAHHAIPYQILWKYPETPLPHQGKGYNQKYYISRE